MTTTQADRYVDLDARRAKAVKVCQRLWPDDLTDRIPIKLVERFQRPEQKIWEKAAGVTTSHPVEFWDLIVELLRKKADWEERNRPPEERYLEQITEALSKPYVPPAPQAKPRDLTGPQPVCILRCLCGGHVPGGRRCPEHPVRWVNPTPDPTRTLAALRELGPVPPPQRAYGGEDFTPQWRPAKRGRR